MWRYVARRVGLVIPTALGILVAVFFLIRLIPGDPARVIAGERATTEQVEAIRHELGLDQPLPVQFWRFLGGVLQGDLGKSIQSKVPVVEELLDRYPATIELTLAAMLLATVVGVLVGIISAVYRNTLLDWGSMTLALLGVSMPVFWLGLVLLMVFAVDLRWLPAAGRVDPRLGWRGATDFVFFEMLLRGQWTVFVDAFRHLVLPAVALASIPLSIIARMTRSTILEVLGLDYVRTARAKGLSERVVIFKHVLRNALLPVVTITGLEVGLLLGGAVLTETVFSWPGIGRYIVLAIYARDYPVVQGGILLIALAFVVVNLVVDLLYAVIDPRIRYA
ncbi:ABC transporter permease [Caldinitratiruptor microaerophilus]|uniref:Peptide ABC transporter permease n=1 Tax=Caldinitratiruptor microaerophilus TaxID=671077 RepID=A0AA35G972_9FIRM|nr:ABC transporter permease [Caldinitratiruptor microaerophilus]BDG61806.1 peptide ABC transporter permease [Caldinitratiruptor microaerophilus]